MAKQQTEKCQGHAHPEPTTTERGDLHDKLYAAIQAVDAAWGFANRTPAFHDLTDSLGSVMAELAAIKRGA